MEEKNFSCVDCFKVTCSSQKFPYPEGCRTEEIADEYYDETINMYLEDDENMKILSAAAEIEGKFYCKLTRVEETVLFAKKIGAKKVGIATCVGTIREARTFAKILRANEIEVTGVSCKVGNRDKTEIGIPEENKVKSGRHEPFCNPIIQARLMNDEKVDLVVLMGLCVGHDTLFFKYCEAPVTVLFTKDRVTGHNAVQPLYLTEGYYSKLLKPQEF